ncbi:glycine--tRNA ligase subunit beta [Raoultibacter massiliensis]|uniref:Glycine--tRNA ligase beta subunit n=1 Tax=Raoultibacter massiliensis TaxID=1852371 RepID=A0ABV1JB32_9ACTN|nr:glycine--tRNA ligase subunit beta [Raoultibacter massiliensis]
MAGNTRTLAFEIGTEEIPAFDLSNATKQLEKLVPETLDALRIPHGAVRIYSTPRRLISIVESVAEETEALVEEHKGPSIKIAFDAEGNPTKAAEGFARGKGVTVEELERREIDGVEYVYATKSIAARAVADLLPEALGGLIEGISWPKSCRWGTQTVLFSRPVRWLVALFGSEIVPVTYANLVAGNATRGHRFLAPGPHKVSAADDLIDVVVNACVVPSESLREEAIRKGVAAAEQETGYRAELPAKTLTEVINLTEYPTVLVGSFDEEFLRVPEEIIVDAMLMHQRYFPLYDEAGSLTNRFIVVSNGNPDCTSTIIDGNERVVRARLADAKFFYEEDLKEPLESYVDRLDEVVFQETLGTMKAKTDRVVALADELASDARLAAQDAADAHRAAYLSKADLVSNAVVEFTSVQGIMGSYYAEASGETAQVARAIADHYRPRFAGDELPESVVGRIVATADKLDTICGLFAVGQGPTGSSDPFALRRAAIGIVNMLAAGLPVSLDRAIEASLDTYSAVDFDRDAVSTEVSEFFVTRTKVMMRDRGLPADVIDAVLATGVTEPAEIIARIEALQSAREDMTDIMDDLATAYARANNLRDAALGNEVEQALMGEAERALAEALAAVRSKVDDALAANEYAVALRELAALRGPIDRFFEDVLIMDDDVALKNNRLRLLNRFVSVFARVADFGKMAKSGR